MIPHIKLRVEKSIPDFQIGETVLVPVDADGNALSRFWRDRILDAQTDQCVSIVADTLPKSKKESKEDNV